MSQLRKAFSTSEIKDILTNIYWYHTFTFDDDLHTEGAYDLNQVIEKYGFDKDLSGKTVLDIGTSDGFLAFYCEQLGGKVLAIDTNKHDGKLGFDPSPSKRRSYIKKYHKMILTKRGGKNKNIVYKDVLKLLKVETLNNFFITKDLLDSNVDFLYRNVYDLCRLRRKFNIVIVGDLVEHLKCPLLALEQIRKVTKEKSIIVLSSPIALHEESFLFKKIRKLAKFLNERIGISWQFLERLAVFNSNLVTYHGNEAGGSFFHFSETAFKEALLASGFTKVTIYSHFSTRNLKNNTYMRRIVYHCYPQT